MNNLVKALGGVAAVAVLAAGPAHARVVIDITQAGGDVDVTANGSLDLTGATFDHSQPYSTGVIPGGSNWYVALGTTAGMDWYQLTSAGVPYGTDGTYFTSPTTSGNAFSIWGFSGGTPLVGVETGYTSGTAISADMTIAGQTIAGMSLMPGTYLFTIPNDTIILNIAGVGVPEPAAWALMIAGFGLAGASLRRRRMAAA
jgi:hypothetical protein